jgi:hypothetical protein
MIPCVVNASATIAMSRMTSGAMVRTSAFAGSAIFRSPYDLAGDWRCAA